MTPLSHTHFTPYPHSPHHFLKSSNLTLNLPIQKPFLIHTPLMSLNKPQTSNLPHHLNPLQFLKNQTLTSYNPIISHPSHQSPPSNLRKNRYHTYI
ncbi:7-cyano-7-deazaguanine synthase, partial [Bacillus sp. WP8]|uniref:7-cyano-7-deazaguanine synthase n=1 Tax=Bacillus sp. WP8 TaxID=756828 RepID=UPI0021B50929